MTTINIFKASASNPKTKKQTTVVCHGHRKYCTNIIQHIRVPCQGQHNNLHFCGQILCSMCGPRKLFILFDPSQIELQLALTILTCTHLHCFFSSHHGKAHPSRSNVSFVYILTFAAQQVPITPRRYWTYVLVNLHLVQFVAVSICVTFRHR